MTPAALLAAQRAWVYFTLGAENVPGTLQQMTA